MKVRKELPLSELICVRNTLLEPCSHLLSVQFILKNNLTDEGEEAKEKMGLPDLFHRQVCM